MIRYSLIKRVEEEPEMESWKFDQDTGAWVCPYCHGPGEPNYLYCPNCGHVIEGVEVWLST